MYEPYFKPQYNAERYRNLSGFYHLLRTDTRRMVKVYRTGKLVTIQYPDLYPLISTAMDFEV